MEGGAEMRVSPPAHVAHPAGSSRIDGHPPAGRETLSVPVGGARPALFHDARELMAENERCRHVCIAYAGVGVRVKVAAADAGGRDSHDSFIRARRRRLREILHPQVSRAMESDADHVSRDAPPGTKRLSGD
jgi:hypothetical protein